MKPKYVALEQQFSAGGDFTPQATWDGIWRQCWLPLLGKEGLPLAPGVQRPWVLLNSPLCTGQLPTTKNDRPRRSGAEVETLL